MHLLIVALLVILCIVGITLFAVYHSLFAVVNLLRAAVIFSNKILPLHRLIVFAGTKVEKSVPKSGIRLRLSSVCVCIRV